MSGEVPLLGDALCEALLVVLQAAAETFGGECSPGCEEGDELVIMGRKRKVRW